LRILGFQVRVHRGQAPARFDTSAIGGVIDIQTHRARKKRRIEVHNSYGSLNSYEGSVLYSQAFGKAKRQTRLLLSYHHDRSDGDFSFFDDNGTPANLSDDQIVKRNNNEFAKNSVLLRVQQDLNDDIRLAFYNNFYREDRGVPGLGTRGHCRC